MKILAACECSGIVRESFRELGHDAWSCDVVASDLPGQHIQADVLTVLGDGWDMMIAHPPCTFLSYAGARWFNQPGRMDKAREAANFVLELWNAPIPRIAIENPRGLLSKWWRYSDQVIQPYYFGEPATKETHLWLKNIPPLLYTYIHSDPFINWTEFGHRSAKERSKTFVGIAKAMAWQWSCL